MAGGDAIGKRFKIGGMNTDTPWLTVVGIYDNVRHGGLDRRSASRRSFVPTTRPDGRG